MASFHVLFSGEVAPGASEEAVMLGFQRTLGIDQRKARQLFTGRTVVLKSQLSATEAQSLVAMLSALGAVCRVRDYSPLPSGNPARFRPDDRVADHTLRDLTAAHLECPRCGHMQLIAEFCARCGIDIEAEQKRRRKEDAIIEKKLKALRAGRAAGSPGPRAGAGEKSEKPALAAKMANWFRKVQQ